MESDEGASSLRHSERSSSTQGVYVSRLGEGRDEVAPKCTYGGRLPHCKFFMWLDRCIAKLGNVVAGKCGEEVEDAAEHFSRMELEWRVSDFEKRVGCLEQRKKNMCWCYVMCLFVVL
ncbi:hypothetical protein PIB30_022268 [Stylosanthes scabra]|uniref:Zinc finger GRF-type domain-containing protein n=1 Tax=Stylosanthes scabra TaxID=79078 RepID=A0ABU6S956_9FABA|nr:hypothetical protein [Stylosanthes scabra]